MKRVIFSTTGIIIFTLLMSGVISAQGMPALQFAPGNSAGMGNMMEIMSANTQNEDDHTAREEAEGKDIWEKLQAKQITCADLSDEDFGALGEYFMGAMMGDSHEVMNNRMIQMMGEEGEEAMHVAMGKRMSNCEPNASLPQNMMDSGMMPMMFNMMGNWSNPSSLNKFSNPMSMMGFGYAPFGVFSWIFMILWWVLVIAGIVALIRWLTSQAHGKSKHEKSPLEILKERYAKGEIDKKEFEDKKTDLT